MYLRYSKSFCDLRLILCPNIYPMSNGIKKTKQKKFKNKYQIFAKELDGISLSNWKSDILSEITNGKNFHELDELIQSINGGGNQL